LAAFPMGVIFHSNSRPWDRRFRLSLEFLHFPPDLFESITPAPLCVCLY
jgi:hypothetical protein